MATTGARDTSTFDICEPWYGDKGGPFTRTFSPAFLSGMRAERHWGFELGMRFLRHYADEAAARAKAAPPS